MPASLVGIGVFRQRTTDLKKRFLERASDRRKQKSETKKEDTSYDYILRNASTSEETDPSNMLDFAKASARIASSYSNSDTSTVSNGVSSLYKHKAQPDATKIVHPVIHKRDIFLKTRDAEDRPKQNEPVKRDVSSYGKAKTTLPQYSLTGSMLCREMEEGRLRIGGTAAPQKKMSPQKPMGLPVNSIMASMLFRTLEAQDQFTYDTHGKRNVRKQDKDLPVPHVVPSHAAPSTVSSVTMYSGSSTNDSSMVRASNDLLAILQSNDFAAFDAKAKKTLYEA